jgi:hypothetical protein
VHGATSSSSKDWRFAGSTIHFLLSRAVTFFFVLWLRFVCSSTSNASP